jgi:hypothetical protein
VPKKRTDMAHLTMIHNEVEHHKKQPRKTSLFRAHMRADFHREESSHTQSLAVQAQSTSLYDAPDNFFAKCVDGAPLKPLMQKVRVRPKKCRRGSVSREFYSVDQKTADFKGRFLDNALSEALHGTQKKKKSQRDPSALLAPVEDVEYKGTMSLADAEVRVLN